jgi:hypothetical protein
MASANSFIRPKFGYGKITIQWRRDNSHERAACAHVESFVIDSRQLRVSGTVKRRRAVRFDRQ